ncbi:MAG: ATP-binding protein [Chloroflexota bacterium]|nr:MAG: ATP-binding protein [Chloroflexota bacterium]
MADVIFDQHFYASIHNEYMRYQFLQLSNQIRALIDSVIINSDFSETAVFETNASSPSDDGTREVSRLGMFSALLSKIGPDDSIATMFTDYCRRLIGLEVASLLTPGPALEISLSGPSQSRLPYGAASLGSRYGMQLLAAILSGRLTGRRQASSIAVYEVPVEVESLVLAEEPETSLHPAAQVLIGEVMAECVGEDLELYYARESMVEGRLIDEVLEERRLRRIEWVDLARDEGRLIDEVLEERRLRGDSVPSNGLQIIATTHSPYVIQGVCKAIRDGKCSHESVVILNCSLKDNATHITPIHVSEAGHIDGWIPSFTDVDNYLFQGWVKGPVSRA